MKIEMKTIDFMCTNLFYFGSNQFLSLNRNNNNNQTNHHQQQKYNLAPK